MYGTPTQHGGGGFGAPALGARVDDGVGNRASLTRAKKEREAFLFFFPRGARRSGRPSRRSATPSARDRAGSEIAPWRGASIGRPAPPPGDPP
jgi:hypothetical protein